tara:strand:- start:12505 stop:12687 length:183 start_codon:yes stop_codon:yes gene_type:complete
VIYVLVGGPRDGQYVDDVPRGYRPDPAEASSSPYDAIEGFDLIRAVWYQSDPARLRALLD